MVHITNFNIERNCSLSIEPDINGEQLLTSGRNILKHGDAQAGGLAINFDISVIEESISRGMIAIVQICKYHHLKVWDSSSNILKNDLINPESGLVLDGMYPDSPLYKRHAIENNKLKAYTKYLNRYLYFDAPYVYLETEWNKAEYKIEFQTIICYTETQDSKSELKKLLEFNWFLDAEIAKEGDDWKINRNDFSSTDCITQSLKAVNGIFDTSNFVNLMKVLNP